jgi:hypothetical protein
MVNDLTKYGIKQAKSLTFMPKNIPDDLFCYWILGYMDGDGCIYQSKRRVKISFTGTLETLILIRNYLKSSNKITLEHRCNNTYKYTVEVDIGEKFLKDINYQNLSFVLKRKREHYSSII